MIYVNAGVVLTRLSSGLPTFESDGDMSVDDPWQISEANFPTDGSAADRLRFLINYAVLAPSSHNTQPWLFRVRDDRADVFADRRRCLPVVDPQDRALVISCGAALGNLRIALGRFGWAGDVRLLPDPDDPDWLASVGLGARHQPSAEEVELLHAIPRRRTTRRPFAPDPLPDTVLARLAEGATANRAELAIATSPEQRGRIADLVAEGDRMQFADPHFRRELAAWVHSRRASSRDGMSFAAFGGPDLLSWAGAAVIRTFDLGGGVAAKDQALVDGSPALAVLATERDGPEAWLAAGQALAFVLLTAAVAGITAAYLNQPIEVAELRPRLREVIAARGVPQLLFRLGAGPALPPTARRPVSEVLMD